MMTAVILYRIRGHSLLPSQYIRHRIVYGRIWHERYLFAEAPRGGTHVGPPLLNPTCTRSHSHRRLASTIRSPRKVCAYPSVRLRPDGSVRWSHRSLWLYRPGVIDFASPPLPPAQITPSARTIMNNLGRDRTLRLDCEEFERLVNSSKHSL